MADDTSKEKNLKIIVLVIIIIISAIGLIMTNNNQQPKVQPDAKQQKAK